MLQFGDLIPRGEGRSYGDPAVCTDGNVIQMSGLNRILDFDADRGLLHCEAGLTLGDIQARFIPRGWMLPVTPGTRQVQVGGAIAADVHGKNHHRAGAFSAWVRELTLLLPSGETVVCSTTQQPDLWRATVGGMGLTGTILTAILQLKPITTAWIHQRQCRVDGLDSLLALLAREDARHEYTVAWVDGAAGGRRLGRGIVFLGDEATVQDLPEPLRREPLRLRVSRAWNLPVRLPSRTLPPAGVRAFNHLYWRAHPDRERLIGLYPFFYPLDSLGNWNRLYGRAGFTQYQFVLPRHHSEEGVARVLEKVSRYGGAYLTVLKRLGAGGGLLSFPLAGITAALDFPLRPGLCELLHELDEIVIRYEGRVYLAKDLRLPASQLREMYHELPDWLEIRRRCDPRGVMQSNLSARLELN